MTFKVSKLESLFTGITGPATAPSLPELVREINANVTITTVCESAQWDKPVAPREIALYFAGAGPLPGPEETELDTFVIPNHTGNAAPTKEGVSGPAGGVTAGEVPEFTDTSGSDIAGSGIQSSNIYLRDGSANLTGNMDVNGNAFIGPVVTRTTTNDAAATLTIENTGTNAGSIAVHVGDRDPVGLIVGNPGDFYIRSDGNDSSVYFNDGDAASNTEWADTTSLRGNVRHTGIRVGGRLSLPSTTTVTVTAGEGEYVNTWTDTADVSPSRVKWTQFTGETLTEIATAERTFLGIDSAGALVQIPNVVSAFDLRRYILLGVVEHYDNVAATSVTSIGQPIYDAMGFIEFMSIVGNINVTGNDYSVGTINTLGLDVTAGSQFYPDINRDGTVGGRQSPNVKTQSSGVDISWIYIRGDGAGGITVEDAAETSIDTGFFDNGIGGLTSMTGSRWKVEIIYRHPDGRTVVQYGQNQFDSRTEAIATIGTEIRFLDKPWLPRYALIVQRDASDLGNPATAEFQELLSLGGSSGAGGGGGGGDVNGPAGGVLAGELTQFSDTTGKVIEGTGIQADTLLFAGTPQFGEGCRLEFNTGTAVTLTAGSVFDGSGFTIIARPASVAVNSATIGAVNGLDAGSLAARTWYAVYIIGDSNGVNVSGGLLSTSFTSPTLPGTHDLFRRVGCLFTDDTPEFRNFVQTGNGAARTYEYVDDVQGPDQMIIHQGGATAFVDIDATEVIPPVAVTRRQALLTAINGSAGVDAYVRHSGFSETRGPHVINPGSTKEVALRLSNANVNIQYGHAAAGGQLTLLTRGYVDHLEDDL